MGMDFDQLTQPQQHQITIDLYTIHRATLGHHISRLPDKVVEALRHASSFWIWT